MRPCAALSAAGEEWRRKLELLAALEVAVPAAAAAAHKVNKAKIISEGVWVQGLLV